MRTFYVSLKEARKWSPEDWVVRGLGISHGILDGFDYHETSEVTRFTRDRDFMNQDIRVYVRGDHAGIAVDIRYEVRFTREYRYPYRPNREEHVSLFVDRGGVFIFGEHENIYCKKDSVIVPVGCRDRYLTTLMDDLDRPVLYGIKMRQGKKCVEIHHPPGFEIPIGETSRKVEDYYDLQGVSYVIEKGIPIPVY